MRGTLIRIAVDGKEKIIELDEPGTSLQTLQKEVGGYIELVKVRYEGRVRNAFVDEDGLRKRLPHNRFASFLCVNRHIIMGTMVIVVPTPRKRKQP